MEDHVTADDGALDDTRLDRRAAMKAAIGGAAAAAALTAPKVSGFSLAPDLAAAASQCAPGTTTAGNSINGSSTTYGLFKCWGTGNALSCNTGVPVSGSVVIPVASPNFSAPTVTATVGGQVKNDNGRVDLVLSNFNLNEPFSSCTVTVNGTCSGGQTFQTGVASTTRTFNGTWGGLMRCTGGLLDSPDGTYTITASCICGPD